MTTKQHDYLIALVTKEEIFKAIKGIEDLIAPRVDGYGDKKFKDTWNITKLNVIVAIKELFE